MKGKAIFHVDMPLVSDTGERRVYRMPVTWAAYRAILEETGVDPGGGMAAGVKLDSRQVVQIAAIGVRCSGADLTEDQVGEGMVRAGLLDCAEFVGRYFAALPHGGVPPQHKPPKSEAPTPGKARRAGTKSKARTK